MRKLSFLDSIKEAIVQSMQSDETVFVYGEGKDVAIGPFSEDSELAKKFGKDRIFDMPLSEEGLTGVGVGAAVGGMRPIMVEFRLDFTLLTMDPIINHASTMNYVYGLKCPFVIKATVGRGWGQGPTHSKPFHSVFAHFPGMKVVLPSNPYDAKGLLIESIKDNNPIMFIEHKSLFGQEGDVPEEMYSIPLGKGRKVKEGKDATVVAFSTMVAEAEKAAEELSKEGINIEIIDPRTSYPLDEEIIVESVKKTGRLVIADIDWLFCGMTAEISAMISENCLKSLKAPIKRIGLVHAPIPVSYALEDVLFNDKDDVIKSVKEVLKDGLGH
jgi:acetoin:2,6-dichlorophenolindophenol oxidoreductase subunit beta